MYRSAPYVDEFCDRISRAAETITADFEIVLVNDGSPDDSLARAVQRNKLDPRVKVVDLSRNFGHHPAIMAGLGVCQGHLVFLIDIDLEEPPECLETLFRTMHETSADVTFGVQPRRKGGLFERLSGGAFWKAINAISGLSIPENPLTARLMTRRYVDALLSHREREIFLAGLWQITGFHQVPVAISKGSHSPTSYSIRRRLALFVNSVTSFSNAPLLLIFWTGIIIFLTSAIYSGIIFLRWLFAARPPEGWASVILSVWMLGGLMICFIGVVGIYIGKIFQEVKQRPLTIIRHLYGFER